MLRWLLCVGLLALVGGCQRPWYRRAADREVYAVEREHENEALWPVANTLITPPRGSRLFDPFNPDYPPMPPDDPAAHYFMHHPDGQPAPRTYHRDGDAPFIEDPSWRDYLPLDSDGNLVLNPDKAVELGILNSREYQQQLENLYTTALTLTLDRFEFAMHWFGTNTTTASWFGSGDTQLNTLTTTNNLGFSKNFAAGGQLLVDFANSFVFTFTGAGGTVATSNLAVTFVQPLLRNAGRRVRLETLTQGERNLLYAVRDFARFREQFHFGLTFSGGGYLNLLAQVQNIRNQEANLKSQEQNLLVNEALYARGAVPLITVDLAFQSYQSAKSSLISARSVLETSLDQYKQSIGLPPSLPIKLDDSLLDPFQLASPEMEKIQEELDRFWAKYRELPEAPPSADLAAGFKQALEFQKRLVRLTEEIAGELGRWKTLPGPPGEEEAQLKRERALQQSFEKQLPEFYAKLNELAKDLARDQAAVAEGTRKKDWETLEKRTRDLIGVAGELYVVQSQVRVFLIQLEPIAYSLDEALAYARENRWDLMNQRARVVDAWRQIDVTASALKTGLDLKMTANVATPPGGNNPFDFRASASQYTVGLALDSPLNRFAERNAYRASQIAYQQARRTFMALDDQIQAAVRQDIRSLQTDRANFNIARQSLISAARQVDSARDRLLLNLNPTETTGTKDVLDALNNLLTAKSALISSWIGFQTDRARLLFDMNAMRLTPGGLPEHESGDPPPNLGGGARLGTPRSETPDDAPARLPPARAAGEPAGR